MGNKAIQKMHSQQQQSHHINIPSHRQSPHLRRQHQASPQQIWRQSSKSIQDLHNLITHTSLSTWPITIRPFLHQIHQKTSYQTYIKVILDRLLHIQSSQSYNNNNEIRQLFQMYQKKLQNSYFVQGQFSQNIFNELQIMTKQDKFYILYQWKVINQQYIEDCFVQMFPSIVDSLYQWVKIIVENHIIIDDQVHFSKFIVSENTVKTACEYAEIKAKFVKENQKIKIYQIIKKVRQQPIQLYINLARSFLQYKNSQIAQVILISLMHKKYTFNNTSRQFYLYIKLYNIFLYELNKFPLQSHQPSQTFLLFQTFESLKISQIFQMYFTIRSYKQRKYLKNCYEDVYLMNQYQQKFNQALKQYVFNDKCDFQITLDALNQQLKLLHQNQKQKIQSLFMNKFLKCKFQVYKFQKKIKLICQYYHFNENIMKSIQILLNAAQLFYLFGTNLQIYELSYFIQQGQLIKKYLNKENILKKQLKQLQFLCVSSIKNLIGKYFVSDKSKRITFLSQCYSIKNIQTIFMLSLWLKSKLFNNYISINQIHQIIFQHMLFFYRYQDIKLMLSHGMISQYCIQFQLIKMIIIQNIDEMLKKQSNRQNKSTINQISGDIKLQFRILQDNIDYSGQGEIQIIQSLKAMYQLIKKLDYHNIVLTQKQKQNNMNVQLLYWLMKNYQDRIEVISWDQIYRLILIYQGKYNTIQQSQHIQQQIHLGPIIKKSRKQHSSNKLMITNEYLKFKIDMSHLCFQHNKIKFGQQLLKQVLIYQPPWISTQIIKIIQSSSIQNFNDSFLKIAFQYCLKGDDLKFLIKIWKKKKIIIKNNNSNKQNIFVELLQSTQKYMITDDTYVMDQKQYRNLVAEMSFNDEVFKSKHYVMFFTLLGTEPFRAFYSIYSKNLDIVKIQIFLKQGMKLAILNQTNIIKIFFNLLYFMIQVHKTKLNKHHKFKVSYPNFKSLNTVQITSRIQKQKYFDQTNKLIKQSVPFIMLKKLFKPIKSLLLLPQQFIQNYICNSFINSHQATDQFISLYNFLYDQNHRSKHLLNLKDQPMGKNDIKLFYELCQINNLNIIDLILFNLTNKLNTTQSNNTELIHQDETIQNMLQKIVTWTENNQELSLQILQKLINKLFSSKMLYEIICYLQQRENVIFKKLITLNHLKIIQTVSLIQISTELYGLIPETFFTKSIQPNPKQHLSQKHVKLLKKQLKLYNVFIISKILYFCYGLSNEIQKQVLKIFLKENQGKENDKKNQFEELKNKLYQINQIYKQ